MRFYKIIIVFSLFIIGTVAGGTAGKLIAGEGAGLAGGATVFMSMIMGIVVGLILGVFLIRLVAAKHLRNLSAILALFAFLGAGYVYMTWKENARMETQGERSGSQKTSILYAATNGQMIHVKEVEDRGMENTPVMGMGMASPTLDPNTTIYFYSRPDVTQLAEHLTPFDSITFFQGEHYIDIATAPPFLVPEYLKLDYNIFLFKVISASRNWLEVEVNKINGQTAFVDRTYVSFLSWTDFLMNVHSVERLDVEANPVRYKALDHAAIIATGPNEPLEVLGMKGDWLMVSTYTLGDRMPPKGYIRWRDGEKLLITYSLLS